MNKFIFPSIVAFMFMATNVALPQSSFRSQKKPFSSKKGVCVTLRTPGKDKKGKTVKGDYLRNMPRVKKLNVGWNYSWSDKLQPSQPQFTSYAPMIYSVYGNPSIERIANNLKRALEPIKKRQRSTILLGFNEPDKKDQANLSVEKALKYWKSLEAQGVPLCSPSTVHPDNEWMRAFMSGAKKKGLRVDYVGVHDYGNGNAEVFKQKLRKIHKMYGGKPIIITEFAVADWNAKTKAANRHSKQKVMKYMKEILPWLDKQDWIVGYAWFPFGVDSNVGTSSALFNAKGELTDLGKFYSNYRSR